MYVPALYPEPPVDIVPAKGKIFNVSCASDPSPPIMFRVGVDLKFTPEFVTAIAVITPVFLSNVGVKSAGVVGCPPITSTVGAIEYPLPPLVTVTVSIGLPTIAFPAAPVPVVSPVASANDTAGALLYPSPEAPIVTTPRL